MLLVLQRSLAFILLLTSQVSGALVLSAENTGFVVDVNSYIELELEKYTPIRSQLFYVSSAPPSELKKINSIFQQHPLVENECTELKQASQRIEPCRASHTPTSRCTQGPPSKL